MDIADEIAKALSEYSEEVAENLEAIKIKYYAQFS